MDSSPPTQKVNPKPKPLSIVILPLPAQGHLNQLLLLSHHLARRSLDVHFVGSSTHNRQARDRSSSHLPSSTSFLHFHDFPLPPFPTPPPNPNPNSPTLFPSHLQPLFNAALHLSSPLSSLLLFLSSSSRRVVLIHDSTMGFAAELSLPFPNVEPYAFHSVSAYTNLFFHLQYSTPSPPPDNHQEIIFEDCFSDEFLEFIRRQHSLAVRDHGRLLNTCRGIEGQFLDRLGSEFWKDQKIFAVGPLNPARVEKKNPSSNVELFEWLRRQPKKSVLYVSFGTTSALCTDQIRELANGLELSQQRFIWVLRDADRGDIYARGGNDRLDGLAEGGPRHSDRGFVVRVWAPQLEILGHEAVGGFLTHCGWNSCMESMTMGVPMLTWPMHSDQPRNSVLVTEVLEVGVVGRDWRMRGEVLRVKAIRDSIVRLMVSEEGKDVRRRAEAVGEEVRQSGVSGEGLDSFVTYISR